jgi:predicted glycoside hydrolase/deacetylase ChbG (UPF0249 family)
MEELLQFKEELDYPIGIGIHLNLTAGPALNKRSKSNHSLYSISQLIKLVENGQIYLVELELHAQIQRFLKLYPQADHLTHHMNVLNIHPQLFNLSLKLAKEYQLPLRNPCGMSMSSKYRNGFHPVLREAALGFVRNIPLFLSMPKIIPKVYRMTKPERLVESLKFAHIKSTDLLCDLFYGRISVGVFDYIEQVSSEHQTIEFLTHPGEYAATELIPKGINPAYLPKRAEELSTIIDWYANKTNIQKWSFSAGFQHI